MSEFTLPANSKVGEGKHWALPKPAEHVKSFRIYRWDPEKKITTRKWTRSTSIAITAGRWCSTLW